MEIERIRNEIAKINESIIKLEKKKTSQYRIHILDSYRKIEENLQRHDSVKPKVVNKPEPKEDDEVYQNQLNEINNKLEVIETAIQQKKDRQAYLTIAIEDTQRLIATILQLENSYQEMQQMINEFAKKYKIEETDL